MAVKKQTGKFIVFEGIDGSGKSTQTKLLAQYLKEKNYAVVKIDFPQHGQKSSGLVDEYLTGKYGSPEEVGPYRASIFYACDRYDASFQIKKWLQEGKIVIADRYLASNIGHQGGKIKNKAQWLKYVKWLYNLEYNLFGIPKPDITIILKSNPDYSLKLSCQIIDQEKLAKRKAYLSGDKKDIHETNENHLAAALNSYLRAAQEFPKDFKVVDCLQKEQLLSPLKINQKIIKVVNKFLKI
ncbi:MAG: deoxynucleoside kinase [Candidatus Gribaldobacteria bacterium]|nr:deoxynucleoside kinase [Candidatus Gribaldobacteria bacterium]